jgi:hypothetical protein
MAENKIIFFAGSINPNTIAVITENKSVNILLPNPNLIKNWKKHNNNVLDMYNFCNASLFKDVKLEESYSSKYSEIQNNLFSDSRTFYLMERVFKFSRENTVFNISAYLNVFILNTLKYIQMEQPDLILAPSTPHHLSWYFCYCAEMLGVKVVYTQTSPIPYKKWIVEGIFKPKPILLKGEPNKEKMEEWVEKLESNYDKAIPEYERKRNETYKYGDGNILSNFKDIIFNSANNSVRYNKLLNLTIKLKSLKLYENLSFKDSLPDKFIILFMHYQPERTSLPEGRNYAQQMSIIIDLHLNLPEGHFLLIKEHPSMFRNIYSKRVRTHKFYQNISELVNVKIASLEYNSFDLIDKSKGVVTITGSVGIEAQIRNKPVLIYGDAQYKHFEFTFDEQLLERRKLFFDSLNIDFINNTIRESTITQIKTVDNHSFFTDKFNFSTNAFKTFLLEKMTM